MLVARAGVLVLALVGCAWFALGARQAHQTAKATALVSSAGRLSPHHARQAGGALDAAGALNPDLQVDVLRGELAIDEGRLTAARRILGSVTRREPQNLGAWIQLARASAGDRVSFFAAEIHIRTLIHEPAGH